MIGENVRNSEEDTSNSGVSILEEMANSFDPEAAKKARQEAMEHNNDFEIAKTDVVSELVGGKASAAVFIEGGLDMMAGELKKRKNDPNAYTAERQVWHEQILEEAMVASEKLSDELGPPPRIIAMRGGCGAGKTTAVKGRYGDRNIFDSNGDVPGAVKPDYFKGIIQQQSLNDYGVEITSEQSHMESTGVCKMFSEKIAKTEGVSMLIDKQLESESDIKEIIEWGKETGKQVELLDNDVPIELSAFRVLKRTLSGADPNITFDSVASGFRGIRINRGQEIEDIEKNKDIVGSFSLRAFDPKSKKQLEIATMSEDGKVIPEPGYEALFREVTLADEEIVEGEIEKAKKQVIDDAFIDAFVARNFDESDGVTKWSKEARDVLGAYSGLGMTFEEAMESKAVAGIDPDRNKETGELNDPNYREKLAIWLQRKRSNEGILQEEAA